MKKFIARTTIAIGLLGLAHSAIAQDCQVIDQFPAEIDRPGKYCLDRSHFLELTGNEIALAIHASDVFLDLRGHTLSNPTVADSGQQCDLNYTDSPTTGIYVHEAINVTIRGGSLRCFDTGIQVGHGECSNCTRGNRVESMRIQDSASIGILAKSDYSIYSNNHIVKVGNLQGSLARGLFIAGAGITIRGNDIQHVDGTGIETDSPFGLVIENRVQEAETGFVVYGSRAVRYRDNVTAGVQRAYAASGTDLGNND